MKTHVRTDIRGQICIVNEKSYCKNSLVSRAQNNFMCTEILALPSCGHSTLNAGHFGLRVVSFVCCVLCSF